MNILTKRTQFKGNGGEQRIVGHVRVMPGDIKGCKWGPS